MKWLSAMFRPNNAQGREPLLVAADSAFCAQLNTLRPGWQITSEGITGPSNALVRIERRDGHDGPGHLDVQFVINALAKRDKEHWDCVVGAGEDAAAVAHFAARQWTSTTAGPFLELAYSGKGEFAHHYAGDDPFGFAGWHCIAGAVTALGKGDTGRRLQEWWLDNPTLPTIASALGKDLDPGYGPFGLKIIIGGNDVAEVRIDGVVSESASSALRSLPWPRLQPFAYLRTYVLLLHPDGGHKWPR